MQQNFQGLITNHMFTVPPGPTLSRCSVDLSPGVCVYSISLQPTSKSVNFITNGCCLLSTAVMSSGLTSPWICQVVNGFDEHWKHLVSFNHKRYQVLICQLESDVIFVEEVPAPFDDVCLRVLQMLQDSWFLSCLLQIFRMFLVNFDGLQFTSFSIEASGYNKICPPTTKMIQKSLLLHKSYKNGMF